MAMDSTYEFQNEWCHADTPSTNAPLPPATQAISGSGRTSIAKGFPEETAKPIDESGIPPYRLDFNGVLRQITANLVWYAKGGMFDWSATKVYSRPAIVRYANTGYYYTCIATSVPVGTLPTNTTYWKRLLNNDDIGELQDLYLPLSGGTLTGALTGTTGAFSYVSCAGTQATSYIGFIGKSSSSAVSDRTSGSLTLKDVNGNNQTFNGSSNKDLSGGVFYSTRAACDANGANIANTYLKKTDIAAIFLAAHPVGCFYSTLDSTNPGSQYGGSWVRIGAGRCLIDAGSGYSAGSTGGSATKTLTTNELPSHTHSASTGSAGSHSHTRGSMNITGQFGRCQQDYDYRSGLANGAFTITTYSGHTDGSNGGDTCAYYGFDASRSWSGSTSYEGSHTHSVSVGYSGGSASFSLMNPYMAVYIWRRIA